MKGCSCESVKVFETENVSTWGGLGPPTFGFMPNALSYWAIRARHWLFHVLEHWLWRYRYFWSKITIWNVNCARATAFIFDTRTGVLVKVKVFESENSRPEGVISILKDAPGVRVILIVVTDGPWVHWRIYAALGGDERDKAVKLTPDRRLVLPGPVSI